MVFDLFGVSLPPTTPAGYSNPLGLAGGDPIDFAIGRGADGLSGRTGLKVQATMTRILTNPPSSTNPPCVTPPAGLVGWWPLDNSSNDAQGQFQTTLTGSPEYIPGKVDAGLHFDAIDDSVQVAANPALDVGGGP